MTSGARPLTLKTARSNFGGLIVTTFVDVFMLCLCFGSLEPVAVSGEGWFQLDAPGQRVSLHEPANSSGTDPRVMNQGKIEEMGDADEIYNHPQTPYTQKLISAIPKGQLEDIKEAIERKKERNRIMI